jgi:transcriptional antiterminator NusG
MSEEVKNGDPGAESAAARDDVGTPAPAPTDQAADLPQEAEPPAPARQESEAVVAVPATVSAEPASAAAEPEAVSAEVPGAEALARPDGEARAEGPEPAAVAASSTIVLPESGPTETLAEDSRPDEKKWYVVTTYSGFENKARQALEERIKKSPYVDLFGEVLVPTEAPPEGKKKGVGRSFFPGYIFVQMVMNEITWTLVKGTPRVTNFVGNQKPTPVPAEQIAEIQRQISEGAIKVKPEVMFSEGDRIRVSGGPFMNMTGTVSSINPVKQVVRVLVSIFGRATPVDLEYHQVEKLP